jgi:hypothetical protein
MTTSAPTQETGLSGSAPLYTRVEPLNPEQHGKLGVRQMANPFGFVSNAHFVPLLAQEFPQAATTYPIIFAGEDKAPLAVMGIEPGTNLYFHKDGSTINQPYLPAYVRRFPFIVANDDANGRAIVCLDVGADIVSASGELKIFNGNELTDYGKNCVDFCQRYEEDRGQSELILKQIRDLDLFHLRQIKHQPRDAAGNAVGEETLVSEYFAVEEPRVHALSAEKLAALRDTGALAYIYSHLISMSHWDRLISLEIQRLNPPANQA